jgi:hypothetical protein
MASGHDVHGLKAVVNPTPRTSNYHTIILLRNTVSEDQPSSFRHSPSLFSPLFRASAVNPSLCSLRFTPFVLGRAARTGSESHRAKHGLIDKPLSIAHAKRVIVLHLFSTPRHGELNSIHPHLERLEPALRIEVKSPECASMCVAGLVTDSLGLAMASASQGNAHLLLITNY